MRKLKKLMNSDAELIKNISDLFGEKAYVGGLLNRKHIGQRVFTNKNLLNELNQLVHPKVFAHLASWFVAQSRPYALYESALIFQGQSASYLDKVIYVYASEEVRISRVMKRDKIARSKVEERMNNQPNPVSAVQKSDFLLINDGQPLIPQVLDIHRRLLRST